ncbi:hypothetical protein SNOG_02193 [Parastagonospora nodorum SN15]|uniref:Uncharacterized protein n=1 Tax=Phaeosphaeria nodorum (strain SN15 / ATCC MYA-4574 / FGSC 10173) TaxID=321614 RepID=Q0V1C1_PHANO|nr:hypothetical protein SNOG_02193 [Parastagonospora nodorum SN15]EAT90405.1 hypothetical protein SNOG_02193 [Parastagonospora nodorum SN15]
MPPGERQVNLVTQSASSRIAINGRGDAPTPIEFFIILEAVRKYISARPVYGLVLAIDNVKRSKRLKEGDVKLGNHHFLYLRDEDGDRLRNEERVVQVVEFCDAVQRRLDQVPQKTAKSQSPGATFKLAQILRRLAPRHLTITQRLLLRPVSGDACSNVRLQCALAGCPLRMKTLGAPRQTLS